MNIKEATREAVRQTCNVLYPDAEMQDAAEELERAEVMFSNADNEFRELEAFHRIKAAKARLVAIEYERRLERDKALVAAKEKEKEI